MPTTAHHHHVQPLLTLCQITHFGGGFLKSLEIHLFLSQAMYSPEN